MRPAYPCGIIRPAMGYFQELAPDGSVPMVGSMLTMYSAFWQSKSFYLLVSRSQQGPHSAEGHPLQRVSIWHFGSTPRAGCHTQDTPSEKGVSPVSHRLVRFTLSTGVGPPRTLWGLRCNICSASITTHPAHKPGLHDSLHHYCSSGQC